MNSGEMPSELARLTLSANPSHGLDSPGKRHMTSLLVLALSDNAGSSSIDRDDAAFVKEHFIPTQIGNLVSLTHRAGPARDA
jgi:hypothetical protein